MKANTVAPPPNVMFRAAVAPSRPVSSAPPAHAKLADTRAPPPRSGADISMLSQFSEEEEVLFPPYTMLNVQQNGAKKRNGSLSGSLFKAKPQPGSVAQLTAGLQVAERTEGGRSFLAVNVEPSFV